MVVMENNEQERKNIAVEAYKTIYLEITDAKSEE